MQGAKDRSSSASIVPYSPRSLAVHRTLFNYHPFFPSFFLFLFCFFAFSGGGGCNLQIPLSTKEFLSRVHMFSGIPPLLTS
ncbi:hypothetical protein BDV29DRAFT_7555 [Aspergillus leporis]|uniref:Transmembrane protein n=1 Tax=Aspergillus leporis TaxID=41062 RepID=A0A5N5WYE2_9EURO|nr:hypothetical protein BDV29DRAFT_7555 [Aspergillus leporis]